MAKANTQATTTQATTTQATATQATATQATATQATATQAPTPHLGKYAAMVAKHLGGNAQGIPPKYANTYANMVFSVGPNAPQKATSCMGVIHGLIAANPGVTGTQLLALCIANGAAFGNTQAKGKYAKGGVIAAPWAVGYIVGGMGPAHKHWQCKPAPVNGNK